MNQENASKLDDKILALKLLTCSKPMQSSAPQLSQKVNSYNQIGPKRTKYTTTIKPYNRFWIFADLCNPPHCVAIASRTASESADLIKYNHGRTFIGQSFFLYEPNFTSQTIGDTLPIITPSNIGLLPFKDNHTDTNTERYMRIPTKPGEQHYFILRNKSIIVKRETFASDPSCNGVQCDRQKSNLECTCFHTTSANSLIMAQDVTFPVPTQFDPTGSTTISGFRSLRTTKIFFSDFDTYASETTLEHELTRTHYLRNKIAPIITYINAHNGWTIFGWYKLGATQDAANESDQVLNEQVSLHLSYLYPSDITFNTDREEFKALLIDA
jgi:hypothetical protein